MKKAKIKSLNRPDVSTHYLCIPNDNNAPMLLLEAASDMYFNFRTEKRDSHFKIHINDSLTFIEEVRNYINANL